MPAHRIYLGPSTAKRTFLKSGYRIFPYYVRVTIVAIDTINIYANNRKP